MEIKELKEEIISTKRKLEDILVDFSNKTGITIKNIKIGKSEINGYNKVIDYGIELETDLN